LVHLVGYPSDRRIYWAIGRRITRRDIIIISDALHVIRGMATTIPATGIMRMEGGFPDST